MNRRVAPVSVTFSSPDGGGTGPSLLGTGEVGEAELESRIHSGSCQAGDPLLVFKHF